MKHLCVLLVIIVNYPRLPVKFQVRARIFAQNPEGWLILHSH